MSGHLRAVDDHGMTQLRPIRVVLADDHVPLRRNLRLLLEAEEDLKVVGEAGDLEGAIRQLQAYRPRVLVLDPRMPDGSIAGTIERLREHSPRTEIVIVTMHENEMFADQALKAGAIGFVRKDRADLELADAVRRAAHGLRYRSPRLRGQ
jgi:DNA-binding NarL/FixJ family response regulator